MSKKIFSTAIFLLLVSSLFFVAVPAGAVPVQTIVIRPDGSISPSNVPIQRDGNTYIFTDNIYATMKIQRSNVVLNGAGYTLQGPFNGSTAGAWVIGEGPNQVPEGTLAEYTIGVDLGGRNVENIVVKNLNIKNFSIGLYMWTKNNTVIGNAICENILGVLISGSNTTVINNHIADNKQGLFFGFNNPSDIPGDIYIWNNGFVNNVMQINGCLCDEYPEDEEPHAWDNGKSGNYWSDYTGVDADSDGIGDTPYVVDVQNQDRYPLMQNPATIPSPSTLPLEGAHQVETLVLVVSVPAVLAVVLLAFKLLKRRNISK